MTLRTALPALAGLALLGLAPSALAADKAGVVCTTPPAMHCSGADCQGALIGETGNTTVAGRKFFLDYPCDLKPDEKVVFILNIHGAGSIGNWQRHYFPAMDYKEKYRLVIATPTAATTATMGPGGPGVRMWQAAADDAHLQAITELVFEQFGRRAIKSFWLAGHSQGGMTSHRIVCSDYFKGKVDGLLSLSGGRIGQAQIVPGFGPPQADGTPPAAGPRSFGEGPPQACDFSHIYETGEREIVALPETSPWAAKYACAPRVRRPDVVDEKPGWVYDTARSTYPVWGLKARPGTAQVFVYPKCKDDRLVADVVRLDKGHTEGLEPEITEDLIRMIVAAPGGKAARGG